MPCGGGVASPSGVMRRRTESQKGSFYEARMAGMKKTARDCPAAWDDLTNKLRTLKELNYVTRRVFAEKLFASRPLHNIVSESYTIVREF